jgi:hypothetical protein
LFYTLQAAAKGDFSKNGANAGRGILHRSPELARRDGKRQAPARASPGGVIEGSQQVIRLGENLQ